MIDAPSETATGLKSLADKHGFGVEAVRQMMQALEVGSGRMAQFDHPDFGGLGQWFSGGMVMVGRMNDHSLKARVSALCEDIAASLPADGWGSRPESSTFSFSSSGMRSGRWWPQGLGHPSSVGAQNATRYAYFRETHRLAVQHDGRSTLYDTGRHVITGISQQQSGTGSLTFTSAQGMVSLADLTPVDEPSTIPQRGPGFAEDDDARSTMPEPVSVSEDTRASPNPPAESRNAASDGPAASPTPSDAAPAPVARSAPHPDARSAPHPDSDILTTLERLAALHGEGILTDAEFSGKKAELLARL